ncbi:MAG TPA: hypothetical protein VK742_01810 [Candidatus Sulfotelmatobacter sp.]|jgi:hypothetical protein|nr:hypothetical protein [Candidatus Sulfotelmatobacter sp.]
MNTRLERSSRTAGTTGFRRQSPGCARRPFQFSPGQKNPATLWQQARVRAIGFSRADLEKTHWKKVWHSMLEV